VRRLLRGTKLPIVALGGLLLVFLAGCVPGRQQVIVTEPVFDPRGEKIAFVSTKSGNAEIYVVNADGTGLKQLTSGSAVNASPNWSPDGKRIVFVSNRDGALALFIMDSDGSNQKKIPITY
jgi:TolB protein